MGVTVSWLCRTFFILYSLTAINFVVMTSLDIKDSLLKRHQRSYDPRGNTSKIQDKAQDLRNIFITSNSTVIVAQIGSTSTLPCVVRKSSQGVVTWIRRADYHLLTVGLTTYTGDDRYLVEHVRHLQNWGLQIKNIQEKDAGLYECQVSTHPPTSIFIELKVVEASSEIIGSPDLHIKSGSTLRLTCRLRDSTEQPDYVFWYHEKRMINYDGAERGVHVRKDKSSSVLEIKDTDKADDGNYTCVPSNARAASINVHVLNATAEEKSAAMQSANTVSSGAGVDQNISVLIFLSFLICDLTL